MVEKHCGGLKSPGLSPHLVPLDLLEFDNVLEPQFFLAQLFANRSVKGFWALCTTVDNAKKVLPKGLNYVF